MSLELELRSVLRFQLQLEVQQAPQLRVKAGLCARIRNLFSVSFTDVRVRTG